MATSVDFIEYVCEQINGAGIIRHKKMFGEYMVYVDEKPTLLVCDNTIYVKMLPSLEGFMRNAGKGHPYKGAKEHYILDVEDAENAKTVAGITAQNTLLPKKKQVK